MGVSYKLGQSKRLRGLLVEASSGAPLILLLHTLRACCISFLTKFSGSESQYTNLFYGT